MSYFRPPTVVRLRNFSTSGGSAAITRSMSASVLLVAEAEANRTERPRVGIAHRLQHVRRFERARRARRSGRHRNAGEVEADQQRLGFDALDADVGGVRHARRGGAVAIGARHRRQDARLQPIAQRGETRPFGVDLAPGDLGGDAESDQRRHVLGARAAIALLAAAGHEGQHAHAALDPQRARAFRTVELVRGDRQQIDAERADIDRQLAGGLHRIGMKQRAALVRHRGELGDWLHGADLVVGVHDRHERRVVGDRFAQAIHRHDAADIHRQQRDLPAALGHRPHGVQHRLVLDSARNQVLSSRRLHGLGRAADGDVVGLGAAGGKDDFRRICR